MTYEDAEKILTFISLAYPGRFSPGLAAGHVWADLLYDLEFSEVMRALHDWARDQRRPPTIADIRRRMAPAVATETVNASRMSYDDYLGSPRWEEVRRAALERADYRCRLCNSTGELHVHHRTYERLGNELESDVILLCDICHEKFHDQ